MVPKFEVSRSGSLAYVPGSEVDRADALVWVDRQGREEPFLQTQTQLYNSRLSPNGKRLAVVSRRDIWVCEIERCALAPLTSEIPRSFAPAWSPDGSRLFFLGLPKGERTSGGVLPTAVANLSGSSKETTGSFPLPCLPTGGCWCSRSGPSGVIWTFSRSDWMGRQRPNPSMSPSSTNGTRAFHRMGTGLSSPPIDPEETRSMRNAIRQKGASSRSQPTVLNVRSGHPIAERSSIAKETRW